jgi:hypothetical protein
MKAIISDLICPECYSTLVRDIQDYYMPKYRMMTFYCPTPSCPEYLVKYKPMTVKLNEYRIVPDDEGGL